MGLPVWRDKAKCLRRLGNRHHQRILRQRRDLFERIVWQVCQVGGVKAHRGSQQRFEAGPLEACTAIFRGCPHHQHPHHAHSLGTGDDGIDFASKALVFQMGVGVHQWWQTFLVAHGSLFLACNIRLDHALAGRQLRHAFKQVGLRGGGGFGPGDHPIGDHPGEDEWHGQ